LSLNRPQIYPKLSFLLPAVQSRSKVDHAAIARQREKRKASAILTKRKKKKGANQYITLDLKGIEKFSLLDAIR
jgi:hypothetical protein